MEETSIDGLVAHCQAKRFTGILRMRAREGIGEVWFLSGVADEMSFGTSAGDEAMERMRKASDATYELVARLPHPGGGFKKRFPSKGSIATATPVTLMRYCEQYVLTCTLAVESKNVLVEARYELGDLVGVETTADDDGITAMLEATDGTYEFTLPPVELPAGTPVLPPAPSSLMESIPPPESMGFRALLETKPAVRPATNEAELKRKTVEIARQHKAAPARSPIPRPVLATPKATTEPAKKEAAKPAEPVKAASAPIKVEPAKKKEEAKPPEPLKPEPVAEAKKEEPKAEPVEEAKKEEPKAPPVEEVKRAAPPVDEEEKEEAEEEQDEEPDSEPAPVAAKSGSPEKRSLTWLVVPLLFAAAIVYLLLTNRM